jgi:ABC-2 type transport system ATP-binding protein
MMGLGRRGASRRLGSVLEFAELEDFVDLKLKNYSAGMMVRLAFAVMVEADADVMLVDEVLAVGDAAFAQKCTDVFREKRDAGKTLVLVTHDMAAVQAFCDRAMLIHDGEQRFLGEPGEATLRYYRLNFSGTPERPDGIESDARLLGVWLEDERGAQLKDVDQGQRFRFNVLIEAARELPAPACAFELLNVDDVAVSGFSTKLEQEDGGPKAMRPGERLRVTAELDNRLVPGRYTVIGSIARSQIQGDMVMHHVRLMDFLVKGSDPMPGMVFVRADVRATVEGRR